MKYNILPDNDKEARKIVVECNDMFLENDVIYHLYYPRRRRLDKAFAYFKQLVVPRPYREIIATSLHERNCHISLDRLYPTAQRRYFWAGMYTFLKRHVDSCLPCPLGSKIKYW